MSNLKHTPGPWNEKAIYSLLRFGDKHDGNWSDDLYGIDEFMPYSEQDANLIAVAPEMLDALIALVKFHRKYETCYIYTGRDHIKCVKQAISIIEKATGLPIEEVLK